MGRDTSMTMKEWPVCRQNLHDLTKPGARMKSGRCRECCLERQRLYRAGVRVAPDRPRSLPPRRMCTAQKHWIDTVGQTKQGWCLGCRQERYGYVPYDPRMCKARRHVLYNKDGSPNENARWKEKLGYYICHPCKIEANERTRKRNIAKGYKAVRCFARTVVPCRNWFRRNPNNKTPWLCLKHRANTPPLVAKLIRLQGFTLAEVGVQRVAAA